MWPIWFMAEFDSADMVYRVADMDFFWPICFVADMDDSPYSVYAFSWYDENNNVHVLNDVKNKRTQTENKLKLKWNQWNEDEPGFSSTNRLIVDWRKPSSPTPSLVVLVRFDK